MHIENNARFIKKWASTSPFQLWHISLRGQNIISTHCNWRTKGDVLRVSDYEFKGLGLCLSFLSRIQVFSFFLEFYIILKSNLMRLPHAGKLKPILWNFDKF
jgi:hypothetical protein